MSNTSTAAEVVKANQAKVVKQFQAALNGGTPLVGINTADQPALIDAIVQSLAESERPCISWDCVNGFEALNSFGIESLAKFAPMPESLVYLADAAKAAAKAVEKTVIFVKNGGRFLEEITHVQALSNLRDAFKRNFRAIVLLGPEIKLPAELSNDVIVIDEPLPDAEQLGAIIEKLFIDNDGELFPEVRHRAVEAVQGLSAFAAEQVASMAMGLDRQGKPALNLVSLWNLKKQKIEDTPGLKVSNDGIKFADLGGLNVIKDYLLALINGKDRPNAVVWIDEIEKMLGGSSGDTSGVSQDQLGTILSFMQDGDAVGVLLVGVPGSGKSAIAKATGNEAGVPTVRFDLGACKGSLVGQSELQVRAALKVIESVSNGRSMWIATCNSLDSLPPELRRRFKCGLFYFDLPSVEEREAIWKVHRKHFDIAANDVQPDDEGWTGAEIEQCCQLAWRLGKTLVEASKFVVPVSQSSGDRINALRDRADGKWLSASYEGTFTRSKETAKFATAASNKRKLSLAAADFAEAG